MDIATTSTIFTLNVNPTISDPTPEALCECVIQGPGHSHMRYHLPQTAAHASPTLII